MDALDYLKTLLDPDRLAVLGLIAAAPRTLPELTADAGGAERDVLVTLAPLLQAGLVARDGDRYRLVREALRQMARDLPQPLPPAQQVLYG